MDHRMIGTSLVSGPAEGRVLASDEPISFWGGWDPRTGRIIDSRHPLSGRDGAGAILAIPFTRGSSTSTAILLESVRTGTAPAGIVSTGTDPFLVLASVVAHELYGATLPIVLVDGDAFGRILGAARARIEPDGTIELDPDAE